MQRLFPDNAIVTKIGYGTLQHSEKVCVELFINGDLGMSSSVNCYFSGEREKGEAARLSKGELVAVIGKYLNISHKAVGLDSVIPLCGETLHFKPESKKWHGVWNEIDRRSKGRYTQLNEQAGRELKKFLDAANKNLR
jgi:hypothetical protein